jgi:hypothetical protein
MLACTLEWQLHVPVLVIIIEIFTPVMHGQKVKEADMIVYFLMLEEMRKKYGDLAQLPGRCSVQ